MSKAKTKEEIQRHKDESIRNLSLFMDSLIESENPIDLKRADLISYWLKDFQQYISQEKSFEASKIKAYKRGDVVKVNLGFNVGSEQGGLRYAIILDKDNKHNANTVTIVPLSSQKDTKDICERDVSLGRELYNRLKSKHDSIKEDIELQRTKHKEGLKKAQAAKALLSKCSPLEAQSFSDDSNGMDLLDDLICSYNDALEKLDEKEAGLAKINAELHRMRFGSVAKIEQITTISKQRIFDPKRSADVLSGISFSETAMNKINEKMKELYIF